MLISRQILPSRNKYRSASGPPAEAIGRLEKLEDHGEDYFFMGSGAEGSERKCERRIAHDCLTPLPPLVRIVDVASCLKELLSRNHPNATKSFSCGPPSHSICHSGTLVLHRIFPVCSLAHFALLFFSSSPSVAALGFRRLAFLCTASISRCCYVLSSKLNRHVVDIALCSYFIIAVLGSKGIKPVSLFGTMPSAPLPALIHFEIKHRSTAP